MMCAIRYKNCSHSARILYGEMIKTFQGEIYHMPQARLLEQRKFFERLEDLDTPRRRRFCRISSKA